MLLNASVRPVILFVVVATALQFTGGSRAEAARGCLSGSVKSMLGQIEKRFGRVRIISTFRKNARIAGSGRRSYHASCRAVDFYPPKGKHAAVITYLKRNFSGGVGTYHCNMRHVHIDSGPRVRWRKCQ